MDASSTPAPTLLERSRKRRPVTEVLCEYVFRPLAHLVVLALLPLRVPPAAVVLASGAAGLAAAGDARGSPPRAGGAAVAAEDGARQRRRPARPRVGPR